MRCLQIRTILGLVVGLVVIETILILLQRSLHTQAELVAQAAALRLRLARTQSSLQQRIDSMLQINERLLELNGILRQQRDALNLTAASATKAQNLLRPSSELRVCVR